MKKIALSLAVIATIALASCGNKAKEADTTAADTMVATEEVVAVSDSDSNGAATEVAAEETVAPAANEAAAPAKEGEAAPAAKTDSAK